MLKLRMIIASRLWSLQQHISWSWITEFSGYESSVLLKISLFFDYVNVSEPGKTTTDETMILLHWTRIARIRKKHNTAQIKHTQTNNWNQYSWMHVLTTPTQRSANVHTYCISLAWHSTSSNLCELNIQTFNCFRFVPCDYKVSLVSLKTTGTGI